MLLDSCEVAVGEEVAKLHLFGQRRSGRDIGLDKLDAIGSASVTRWSAASAKLVLREGPTSCTSLVQPLPRIIADTVTFNTGIRWREDSDLPHVAASLAHRPVLRPGRLRVSTHLVMIALPVAVVSVEVVVHQRWH